MDKVEKAFEIQRQARDNVKVLRSYLTDLENWETEMKRKEAALNGDFEQDLPPVRSKIKKEKTVRAEKVEKKKISGSDYNSWDKFDADKACEEIDMEDVGPTSLDSKKSQQAKQEKLREEAQYEKERGNTFVKQEKWDEAISCYNRAIELVKDDAIYYANRGLCYLKKESLHLAEADCTEALRLDPTYVKALQRRAAAREKLGSLKAASNDLCEVLKFEPHNTEARRQLASIKFRMGTKGAKSKSSPSSTPTSEKKVMISSKSQVQPKIVEYEQPKVVKELTPLEKWRDGIGENVTVIKPVTKPVHLRSKRALKLVPIYEIPLGNNNNSSITPPTHMKIIEIEDNFAHGDTNNNDSNKIDSALDKKDDIDQKGDIDKKADIDTKGKGDIQTNGPESEKLIKETLVMEKDTCVRNMVAPVNSVQFMAEWKRLKGKDVAKGDYLSIIEPAKIPTIFANALESNVLSELLFTLHENRDKFKEKSVAAYLKGLSKVKRFSALAMFLSNSDKEVLTNLLNHCKTEENCSDEELTDLKNKYEL